MSDSPKLPPIVRILIALAVALALFAVAMQIFTPPRGEPEAETRDETSAEYRWREAREVV